MHISFIYQINHIFSVKTVNIHTKILYTIFFAVDIPFCNTTILQFERIEHILSGILRIYQSFRNFLLCISNRYIGTALFMLIDKFSEIKIYSNIRICNNHIFFFLFFQIRKCMMQCFDTSVIQMHAFLCIWRPNRQTTVLTNQIPLTTGTKMIHQRMIFLANQYRYVVDSTVYHTGKYKIDHTITACKRNRAHQPLADHFRDKRIIVIRENNSQCACIRLYHSSSPSFTFSRTMALEPTVAPSPT